MSVDTDNGVVFTSGIDVIRVDLVGNGSKVRLTIDRNNGLNRAEAMDEAGMAAVELPKGEPRLRVPYVFERSPSSLIVQRAMGESLDPGEMSDFYRDLDGAELRYLLLEMMTMFQRRAILRKYCEWVGKLHERNKYAFEDFKASGLRFTDKTGVDFSVVDPPQIKIEEGTPENMARRYDSVPSTLSKLKNELFVNILNPTNSNKIQTILDVLWEKLLTESKLSDGLVDFGKLSLLMDPVNGDEVVGRLFLDIEAGLDFETRDMASGLTDEQILRVQNRTRAGRNVSGLNKLVLELGEYVKTNPENEAIKRFGGYILVETPGVKRYFGLNGARSVIIINSEDGGKEVVDEGDRQEMSEMVNYILRSWFN